MVCVAGILGMFLCRHLKHEEKQCMEELQCNIVIIKWSQAKLLRLNSIGSQKKNVEEAAPLRFEQDGCLDNKLKKKNDSLNSMKGAWVRDIVYEIWK